MPLILFFGVIFLFGCSTTDEFSGSSIPPRPGPIQSACEASGAVVGTSEYDQCVARGPR
jgi:hypothetical protein